MALGNCLFKVFAYAVPLTEATRNVRSVNAVAEASKRVPNWLSDEGGMFAVAIEPRGNSSATVLVAAVVVNFSSDLVALAREFDALRSAKVAAGRSLLHGESPAMSATSSVGSLRDLDTRDLLTHDMRAHISTVRDGVGYAVVLRHLLRRALEAHTASDAAGDALQAALLQHSTANGTDSRAARVGPLTSVLCTFSGRSVAQLLLAPAMAEVQVSACSTSMPMESC